MRARLLLGGCNRHEQEGARLMTARAYWIFAGGMIVVFASGLQAKTAQTYYTPERIAIGRENVERYDWAKQRFDTMMAGQPQTYIIGRDYVSARDYAAQSDEFMWLLQPTTKLPRVFPHETVAMCPVHGKEVRKKNAWHPWRVDPINHPYQIQCMLGGEWYPSNDYVNGDMTSGEFPDDGDGVIVDGKRYYMLREYAHAAYCAVTIPCLRALSEAWVLTGDRTYAHKCAVLLARLASEYPNHDDRKDRLYLAPYGGTHPHYRWKHGGMITDLIWENFCTEAAVLSYDAIHDYLGDDPELIPFLREKGLPVENADDLREYIEHYLLRAAATGLLNGAIRGNEGHHQALAMTIALVLDDYSDTHPNSLDMIDYTYHGVGRAAYMMINGLYRDGGGHESPTYNRIKLDFIRVSRLMEHARKLHPDLLPESRYPDLFANPKAASLFDYFIEIQVLNYFLPSIGDCGGIRAPRRVGPRNYSMLGAKNVFAFQKYGDPRYARAATRCDGSLFPGEVFEPYSEDAIRAALEQPESEIKHRSRILDDYGVAILESGEGDHRRAVTLNYAAFPGHRQQDNLNLEIFARGVNILPDLGYPFTWDYRWQWDAHIMAHNTVSVGETGADTRVRLSNEASMFAGADGVHVINARHDPYPKGAGACKASAASVDLYERTAALVDIDAERFYVVDLFAVNGGEQRDQSWHGPLVPVQPPDLDWQEQGGGTLAGPGVEQFAKYTDKWGRTATNFPCYLANIRRATLDGPAVWSWDYGLPEGDRLNLHVIPLGGPMEMIMGTGRSPARPDDWGLDYVFARRHAPVPERSLFLSVLDPYQKTPVVEGVRVLSENPLRLEVTYDGGRDVIHLATPPGPSRTTAHRDHGLRVQSFEGDLLKRDVQIGRWAPGEGLGVITETIQGVNYDADEVAIPYSEGWEEEFRPGLAVRIFNEKRTALFRIEEARRVGPTLRLTLDTTALLARGPVVEVEDGALTIGAHFTLSTGGVDEDGKLAGSRHLYFAGSRLGEGEKSRVVRGTWRQSASSTKVFVDESVSANELGRDYGDHVISVWQYGVGDTLELVRVYSETH